jgi:hypothetical protein
LSVRLREFSSVAILVRTFGVAPDTDENHHSRNDEKDQGDPHQPALNHVIASLVCP